MAMSSANTMINGRLSFSERISGRPIPKRGQVKVAIVLGLANSLASIFSRSRKCSSASHLSR
ncbi:hypothetical protein L6164_032779 [Bauhinia variegata]|uniref:Uncharacterized protein n=1 Tax=Bauhinia variegata TaxID=167791 RepID=A0ACB9KQ47_BAUVA|nr:hypothetical protein L6164_032779 [Bauhinia variegata]